MYRRLTTLAAAAVMTLALAAMATADAAVPLAPDVASTLIADPGSEDFSETTDVDPGTALAASSLPGATTDYASDLTLAQAVGLDPTTTAARASAMSVSAVTRCWANLYSHNWGKSAYQQTITDSTFWCAKYGARVTFRTTRVTTDGALCSTDWRKAAVIAGGVGFPAFTLRTSAQFACKTSNPSVVHHPTHHLDIQRDARGLTTVVGAG